MTDQDCFPDGLPTEDRSWSPTGRRAVVMGLGRFGGGIGVVRWLVHEGAEVIVSDQAEERALADSLAQLGGLPITVHCGGHDPADLTGADLLVVSPAVDRCRSAFVKEARRRGVRLTSEINLFLERCRGRVIGVTGTTGKSTTCAMIHAVLDEAARQGLCSAERVWLGGNIGRSLLADLPAIGPGDWVVLELSSFQLEHLAAARFPVVVITNLRPHHLERHGTFAEYLASKLNLCRCQNRCGVVVVGPRGQSDADAGDRFLTVAARKELAEVVRRTGAQVVEAVTEADWALAVPGEHNRDNAAVAVAVAEQVGLERAWAAGVLAGFAGLPHRLERVGTVGGAVYYNDSKATSPEAVGAALRAFGSPVVLLVGGRRRPDSWDAVRALRSRIKQVVCFGEAGPELGGLLRGLVVRTVSEAVAAARRTAEAEDIVLFSPGCPSYDQFVNYTQRGEAFVQAVRAAENVRPRG